jgi:L-asparaginase II
MPATRSAVVPVAEIVRHGFVEGHHYGSVVALDPDGTVAWSVGDVADPILPRSCNKPLQALGMLRAGLDLPPDLLALACASHSGEPFHVEGVRRLLAAVGLSEADLRTPPDYPLDDAAREQVIRDGGQKAPVLMNCSGKHAAMLATCVVNGWPTDSYPDPDHPLQRALLGTVERLAGEQVVATGVDGCGAPLFALTLAGLARAFVAIATASPGTPEHRVAEAIRANPAWLGGTRRDVTALIAGVPGLIAKDGAEGVYAAALPDGRAVTFKVDDGAQRARPPIMVAALRALGVDAPVLDDLADVPLLGGGRPVGEVRAAF